jgi:hypothetical protein
MSDKVFTDWLRLIESGRVTAHGPASVTGARKPPGGAGPFIYHGRYADASSDLIMGILKLISSRASDHRELDQLLTKHAQAVRDKDTSSEQRLVRQMHEFMDRCGSAFATSVAGARKPAPKPPTPAELGAEMATFLQQPDTMQTLHNMPAMTFDDVGDLLLAHLHGQAGKMPQTSSPFRPGLTDRAAAGPRQRANADRKRVDPGYESEEEEEESSELVPYQASVVRRQPPPSRASVAPQGGLPAPATPDLHEPEGLIGRLLRWSGRALELFLHPATLWSALTSQRSLVEVGTAAWGIVATYAYVLPVLSALEPLPMWSEETIIQHNVEREAAGEVVYQIERHDPQWFWLNQTPPSMDYILTAWPSANKLEQPLRLFDLFRQMHNSPWWLLLADQTTQFIDTLVSFLYLRCARREFRERHADGVWLWVLRKALQGTGVFLLSWYTNPGALVLFWKLVVDLPWVGQHALMPQLRTYAKQPIVYVPSLVMGGMLFSGSRWILPRLIETLLDWLMNDLDIALRLAGFPKLRDDRRRQSRFVARLLGRVAFGWYVWTHATPGLMSELRKASANAPSAQAMLAFAFQRFLPSGRRTRASEIHLGPEAPWVEPEPVSIHFFNATSGLTEKHKIPLSLEVELSTGMGTYAVAATLFALHFAFGTHLHDWLFVRHPDLHRRLADPLRLLEFDEKTSQALVAVLPQYEAEHKKPMPAGVSQEDVVEDTFIRQTILPRTAQMANDMTYIVERQETKTIRSIVHESSDVYREMERRVGASRTLSQHEQRVIRSSGAGPFRAAAPGSRGTGPAPASSPAVTSLVRRRAIPAVLQQDPIESLQLNAGGDKWNVRLRPGVALSAEQKRALDAFMIARRSSSLTPTWQIL